MILRFMARHKNMEIQDIIELKFVRAYVCRTCDDIHLSCLATELPCDNSVELIAPLDQWEKMWESINRQELIGESK